jgi:hypothetical protein
MIEVILTQVPGGHPMSRSLLADTGVGSVHGGFDLLLEESICLLCGGMPAQPVVLGGSYAGSYPIYLVRVRLAAPGFDQYLPVVDSTSLQVVPEA